MNHSLRHRVWQLLAGLPRDMLSNVPVSIQCARKFTTHASCAQFRYKMNMKTTPHVCALRSNGEIVHELKDWRHFRFVEHSNDVHKKFLGAKNNHNCNPGGQTTK